MKKNDETTSRARAVLQRLDGYLTKIGSVDEEKLEQFLHQDGSVSKSFAQARKLFKKSTDNLQQKGAARPDMSEISSHKSISPRKKRHFKEV